MKISDNITYAEAIHSQTAKRRGIDNTPTAKQVEVMKLTAEKIFEPLRKFVGGPIKVNPVIHLSISLITKHIIYINCLAFAMLAGFTSANCFIKFS